MFYDFFRFAQYKHSFISVICVSFFLYAIYFRLFSFLCRSVWGQAFLPQPNAPAPAISGQNPVFFKKRLTFSARGGILTKSAKFGPVAQLGERSVRIREVKGSNPSRSTRFSRRFACGFFFAIFRQVLPGCVFTLSANQYTIKGKFGNRAFFRFCRQEGEGR